MSASTVCIDTSYLRLCPKLSLRSPGYALPFYVFYFIFIYSKSTEIKTYNLFSAPDRQVPKAQSIAKLKVWIRLFDSIDVKGVLERLKSLTFKVT